jgi:hypothetical protein
MLPPKRLTIVIIVIAVQAVTSIIVMFISMPIKTNDYTNNDVTSYRQELAQIKAALPEDAVIGYAPIERTIVPPKEYYLAQYVLAPVIIKYNDQEKILLKKSGNKFFLETHKK